MQVRNCGKWSLGLLVTFYGRIEMRAFSVKIASASGLFREIQTKAFEWMSRRSNNGAALWDLWVTNPKKCRLVGMK